MFSRSAEGLAARSPMLVSGCLCDDERTHAQVRYDVLAHALLPLWFVAESAGNLRFRGVHHALSAWSIASGSAENLAAGRTLPSSEPPFNLLWR
jgi:hypothetical protein